MENFLLLLCTASLHMHTYFPRTERVYYCTRWSVWYVNKLTLTLCEFMVVILAGSIDGETTINYIVCALIFEQYIYLVWFVDYDFQR